MDDKPMSIVHHLGELRKRLVIAALAVAVGTIASYSQVGFLRELLRHSAEGLELIYLTPPEVLMTDIKLSMIAGILITSPIVLYQVWAFILPGLRGQERRIILPLVLLSVVCFSVGITFSYVVVLPIVIRFFLGFSGPGLTAMFSYTRYVSFFMTILFAFGAIFQLPLIIVFLARIGMVTTATLRRVRKFAYLAMLIGSAVFTPPDVISQLLMAGPLVVLYEISILLAWLVTRKKQQAR